MSLAPTVLLVVVPAIITLMFLIIMVNCVCAQLTICYEDSWKWTSILDWANLLLEEKPLILVE
jgi:hypothetical protein